MCIVEYCSYICLYLISYAIVVLLSEILWQVVSNVIHVFPLLLPQGTWEENSYEVEVQQLAERYVLLTPKHGWQH